MENNSPYFTLVIPTYNRAALIAKTLDSLKHQTFTNFEAFIVDDGGGDNTKKIVENLGDIRFKYLWKINEERAVARNTGTKLSSGKYINFFDSDDLAYPNHLQSAYDFIKQKNKPEVFHLAYDFKSPDGKLLRTINQLPSTVNEALVNGNTLSCNGVFVRNDIAKKYPFNPDRDLSATEDYVLWLQLASRFPFYNINQVTSSVIDHDGRSVIKINREKLIKRKELSIKYLEEDEEFLQRYGNYLKKIKSDTYTYIALHLAIAGYPRNESIYYLTKSLKYRLTSFFQRRFWGTIKTIVLR